MSLAIINIDPTVVVDYGTINFEVEETIDFVLEKGMRFVFEPKILVQGSPQQFTGELKLNGIRTLTEPIFSGFVDCPPVIDEIGLYRIQAGSDTSKALRLSLSTPKLIYSFSLKIDWMQKSGSLCLVKKTSSEATPTVFSSSVTSSYSNGINGVIKYYFPRAMVASTFPSRPAIDHVQKTTVKIGEETIIYGAGFGTIKGKVIIGSYELLSSSIATWNETMICVRPQAEDADATGTLKIYRTDIDQMSDSSVVMTISAKALPVVEKTNFTNNTTRQGINQKMVVTGTGFGDAEGQLFIGTQTLELLSWSSTRIEAAVAPDTVTGNLTITTADGDLSNSILVTFLSLIPEIDFVIPDICEVNSQVCLTGRNFGSSVGTVTVGEQGAALSVTTWTDTYIVATVPTGVNSGDVKVLAGASRVSSNAKPLAVTTSSVAGSTVPIIARMTPPGGPAGTHVVITGNNFGTYKVGVCYVILDSLNMEVVVTSWSNTSITCKVPLNAKTGYVKVNTQYGISNEALFIVADEALPADVIIHPKTVANTTTPTITHTSPTYAGHGGNKLTIYGENFGRTLGSVKFGATELQVVSNSWTKNSVQVYLPDLWSSVSVESRPQNMVLRDLLYLSNSYGYSNKISFTVLAPAPVITRLSATTPKVGDTLTITGTYFGSGLDTENNYIRFGSTPDRMILRSRTEIKSWSDTSITLVLPDDIDYSMKYISVVVDKIKSEWLPISVSYVDAVDSDPISIGDIKNANGQIIASTRRNVAPIVGIPAGAPTVANLNAAKFNGRYWEDIEEMIADANDGSSKLLERLSTINGVAPNAQNNIKLCGSGNVEIVPNPDANEIIISGLPLESGEATTSSNVIVNYGGIVNIKGEDGVLVTNSNGVVTISLDIGSGVNQVSPGDHNHSGTNNYVVYA